MSTMPSILRPDFDSTSSTSTTGTSTSTSTGTATRRIFRCWLLLLLDVSLALFFGTFLVVSMGRRLYHTYYDPILFDRARRTNDDLREEYTYYHRECTQYDLSLTAPQETTTKTTNSNDLLSDLNVNNYLNPLDNVKQLMMTHGAMIIPNVLSDSSRAAFREYIARRNAEISSFEQFPVQEGFNRISYGIDATAHPAVTNAIAEIAANPLVKSTLQQILGDVDPALAEITPITGFAGCPDQVWHVDTTKVGNSAKFARTYFHSYTLFVALQDITHTMGVTELCPGSQYCGNNLETLCQNHHVRLATTTTTSNSTTTDSTTSSSSFWKAGDAILMNQDVWHRGSAHRDPQAPERILLLLTFVSRPPFSGSSAPDDTRQLARATYFHHKWYMWGHTYQDLEQPLATMRRPWSILRSLGLWKPSNRNWGLDLVTAVSLRLSNNQLERNKDLPERWIERWDQMGFPSWLRRRVVPYRYWDENQQKRGNVDQGMEDGPRYVASNQRESWSIFLRETWDNMVTFAQHVYLAALATYLILVLLAAAAPMATVSSSPTKRSNPPPPRGMILQRAARRLLVSHAIVAGLVWYIWHGIETSPWARNILNGKTLMRPFPPLPPMMPFSMFPYSTFSDGSLVATSPDDVEHVGFHDRTSGQNNNGAAGGLITTTLPQRNDVLLGTRYSAKFLGSYDRWLDFHPGNVAFWKLITEQVAPYYYYHNNNNNHDDDPLWSSTTTTKTNTFSLTPWQQSLLEYVRREISRHNGGGGRLLQQDYRTGDWKLFASPQEELWAIHQQVVSASHPALEAIRRELDHAIAHCRLGVLRGTALARLGLRQLGRLQKQIFFSHNKKKMMRLADSTSSNTGAVLLRPPQLHSNKASTIVAKSSLSVGMLSVPPAITSSSTSSISSFTRKSLPILSKNVKDAVSSRPKSDSGRGSVDVVVGYDSRTTLPMEQEKLLRPGTSVNVVNQKDRLYYPAVIMSIDYATSVASVSYIDGNEEDHVALSRIAVRHPIVQGSPAVSCYSGVNLSDDDCFPGTIARVHASGAALIEFEDRAMDWRQPWEYYIPPFRTVINPET